MVRRYESRSRPVGMGMALFALLTGFAPAAHPRTWRGCRAGRPGGGRGRSRRRPADPAAPAGEPRPGGRRNVARGQPRPVRSPGAWPRRPRPSSTTCPGRPPGRDAGWSDAFETAAGPVYSTIFVAGMFTRGPAPPHSRFRAMTYDMLDAAVVNFGCADSSSRRSGASGRTGRTPSPFRPATRQTRSPWPPLQSGTTAGRWACPRTLWPASMGVSRMRAGQALAERRRRRARRSATSSGRTVVRVNGQPEGRRSGSSWASRPSWRGTPAGWSCR